MQQTRGYIIERGREATSTWNPTVALDPELHDIVDKYQRALGLDPNE